MAPACIFGEALKLSTEAADEIDHLRAGNQKAALDYLGQIGQLSDENTRLRAALRDIRDMGPMTVDDQRWRIARAALEGK